MGSLNRGFAPKRAFTCDAFSPELMRALTRSDFELFLKGAFPRLNPGQSYVPDRYISAIAHKLELVRTGKLKRLIINLPPRMLKSTIASVAFPAFLLGHKPQERIICASYGEILTAKLSNDFRTLVTSDFYRRLFPDFRVSKNTENQLTTSVLGSRFGTTVNGPITGLGADLIIIDDPIKAGDAQSETRRNAVNEWFTSSVLSRLDDKVNGAIVVVMQRVHVGDLTGFLTANSSDWEVLSLPAIAEQDTIIPITKGRTYLRRTGDVLSEQREPRHVLDKMRMAIGLQAFSAQYQQAPEPPEGAMVKREWVGRYLTPPNFKDGTIYLSWDTASKGGSDNAFSVCVVLLRTFDDKYYILDVYRGRLLYPELRAKAKEIAKRYRYPVILIEDAATGIALIEEMRRLGKITAIRPVGDKQARFSAITGILEQGRLLLPVAAPWLAQFEREIFSFPNSEYGDQADALSQALNHSKRSAMHNWAKLGRGSKL